MKAFLVAGLLLSGSAHAQTPAKPAAVPSPPADISAISVRFFGDTCLKYINAPPDLVKFLDGNFPRQDAAHNLAFRQTAQATDSAIVWLANLPEGNFAVVWDPGHYACHIIGQKALDAGKVRAEFNHMIADINSSGQLQAKLIASPPQPGSFTENIQIDGLPGRMLGVVASVNTAQKAGQAGSFYTLFVHHTAPAAGSAPRQAAATAVTPPPALVATPVTAAVLATPAAAPPADDVITP